MGFNPVLWSIKEKKVYSKIISNQIVRVVIPAMAETERKSTKSPDGLVKTDSVSMVRQNTDPESPSPLALSVMRTKSRSIGERAHCNLE